MRLTCPNCGAEYEVPEGLIPPGGKHVQCTSCHTRWFMRGTARPMLSEDQIIRRLETWSPRPRPVPFPSGITPLRAAETEPVPQAAAEVAEFVWETPETAGEVAVPPPPPPVEPPPDERPPASVSPVPARDEPPAPPTTPRLELSTGPTAPAPPRPARNRFLRGFCVAMIVAGLAIGVYVWREAIAAQVPAVAPAIESYGATVDGAREWIDHQLAVLRGEAAP